MAVTLVPADPLSLLIASGTMHAYDAHTYKTLTHKPFFNYYYYLKKKSLDQAAVVRTFTPSTQEAEEDIYPCQFQASQG